VSTKPIYAKIPDPVRQLCSAGDHLLGHPGGYRGAVWGWQISAVPQARRLMFWGLALAVAGNAVAALGPDQKPQGTEIMLGMDGGFYRTTPYPIRIPARHFNFNWLKQTLLWLQKHFP
jgi:hypothetical protein